MTDKEAIEALRKDNELCYKQCEGACCDVENDKCTCGDVKIVSAFEELEQYRTIGTVEECREAREKQISQKPIRVMVGAHDSTDGCPVCKTEFYEKHNFCPTCGNKMDWDN